MTAETPLDHEAQPTAESPAQHFEDLTLAQATGRLLRAPRATLRALSQVAQVKDAPLDDEAPIIEPVTVVEAVEPVIAAPVDSAERARRQRRIGQLGLRLTAFVLAWYGAGILANSPQRTEETALNVGLSFMLVGLLVWLAADLFGSWGEPRRRDDVSEEAAAENVTRHWAGIHPARVLMGLGGLFLSVTALVGTLGNQFTTLGFWAWIGSILLWVGALAPVEWGIGAALNGIRDTVRGWRWRDNAVLWALIAVLLLGAVFRLTDLSGVPPEMTSDHVEKILDAQRVLDGQHSIFFPNNGGRESFQMYAMALLSLLPGLEMNFTTLKLLSTLEGLVAIAVMFWLGREIAGRDDRRLGIVVGVVLAALVAASYWHTALSRLGLRIILTTIVTGLLLIFLSRAMRDNRRGDYIMAGLVLGFGLYTYQAVRMLPVVVLLGIGLAFLFQARSLRMRRRYLVNLIVLVWISFVVFVPLFGYSVQYPEDFWRRTSGRLLGDDVITVTDEEGNISQRQATLAERVEAFGENVPILASNYRNALLMFNWKGDVAWINAAPNRPAMDTLTGALLVVGVGAWIVRLIRRRDVVELLIPLTLLVMLLPSALSIAYPVENPSHTRTSGALPSAYLIAALPLSLLFVSIRDVIRGRRGQIVAVGLVVLVVFGAYAMNADLYFKDYRESYIVSSLPYSEAGRVLRGFAESDGSYGNAFMIAYPFWWDHRAVGIAGGRPDWPNGILTVEDVPNFLFEASLRADDFYPFDPDLDILFFFAAEDEETPLRLSEMFPQGYAAIRQSYQLDDKYGLFRVPRMGEDGFAEFLQANLP